MFCICIHKNLNSLTNSVGLFYFLKVFSFFSCRFKKVIYICKQITITKNKNHEHLRIRQINRKS